MGIQYSDLSPGSSLRSEFTFSTSRFKGEEIDRLQQTGATSEKTEGALHGVSEATERTESGEAATVRQTLKHYTERRVQEVSPTD